MALYKNPVFKLKKSALYGKKLRKHRVLDAMVSNANKSNQEIDSYLLPEIVDNLERRQKLAVDLLTDYLSPLKASQICTIVGIHPRTLRAWRYDPVFMRLLDAEITRKKALMRLEAYKGFFKAIRQGDTKTIRDYFKMTGDLTEEVNVNINDPSEMSEEQLDAEIKDMEGMLGVKPRKRYKTQKR